MTLLWMDGFDHYNGKDDVVYAYDRVYVSHVSTVLNDTKSRWNPVGQGFSIRYSDSIEKWFSNKTTICFGVAFWCWSGIAGYNSLYPPMAFKALGSNEIRFDVNSSFYIEIRRGTTLIGTSSAVCLTDAWNFIEAKLVHHNSAGEIIVNLNGSQVYNQTGLDTVQNQNFIDAFLLGGIPNSTTSFDDLWIDDANLHGDCQVKTFMPDSGGNYSQFTPSAGDNYDCVNEELLNEDTDYVEGNTVGNKDTYKITTGELQTVKGIQVNNCMKKLQAGERYVKNLCRSGGTDYQSDAHYPNFGGYEYLPTVWELDPDDSNPWTQVKLEAAEFGLEITI